LRAFLCAIGCAPTLEPKLSDDAGFGGLCRPSADGTQQATRKTGPAIASGRAHLSTVAPIAATIHLRPKERGIAAIWRDHGITPEQLL
jgi:hypothetical protein